jgi:hypothetical protein
MNTSLICNHCGKEAVWVENKEIYGRNYGDSYMVWWCKPCDAFVGCHKNTRVPKGRFLAKRELREARKLAHSIIDPLWKSGRYSRNKVYMELARAFKRQVHVGDTETPEECHEIIKTAKLIFTP